MNTTVSFDIVNIFWCLHEKKGGGWQSSLFISPSLYTIQHISLGITDVCTWILPNIKIHFCYYICNLESVLYLITSCNFRTISDTHHWSTIFIHFLLSETSSLTSPTVINITVNLNGSLQTTFLFHQQIINATCERQNASLGISLRHCVNIKCECLSCTNRN